MKGSISSIETMGLVDGPGIRLVFFLQGCPLRCLFCHNPETWERVEKTMMSPEEVLKKVLRYKNYFGEDGGVTFSGGEPLYQSTFLLETLKLLKENGIHTVIDTSGVSNYEGNKEEILKYVDLVLWDVKAIDEEGYKKMTGLSIKESLDFLELCQRLNKKMWIRQVIVPGINDTKEYILRLKEFLKPLKNIEKIELLPYHTMGIEKYKNLGLKYRLSGVEAMDKDRCKELETLLKSEK